MKPRGRGPRTRSRNGEGADDLFAVCAPGFEALLAAELRALGVAGVAERGGVAFRGGSRELYDVSLGARTASRVLLRLATFRATAFWEMEKAARRVAWGRVASEGTPVRFRVTSHRSRLYHEGAAAERLAREAARAVGAVPEPAEREPGATEREREPAERAAEPASQGFVVRIERDVLTVSADASGALLHRRGYREAVAKAPLRETLAAAMVLACGWDGAVPLLDPFCGSGTIAIEAALIARRIPPGLAAADRAPRAFAFQRWPGFDGAAWAAALEAARCRILTTAPAEILASDRDAGAIEAARANAARAGVEGDVVFDTRALSAVEPPAGPGLLLTNPPYGARVGEVDALRDLYAALGGLARRRLSGWTLALLSAERRLEGQVGLAFEERMRTRNGGIPVRLVRAVVGDAV